MAKQTLKIKKGDTFRLTLKWLYSNNVAKDLTGYTGTMKIKSNYSSTNTLLTVTDVSCYSNGNIEIVIPAANTATLTVNTNAVDVPPRSNTVYEITLTSGSSEVHNILYGTAIIDASL